MAVTLRQSKSALLTVNGVSVSVTMASATVTGNLLVMQHIWTTGSTADNNIPSGWTQIGEIRYSVAVPIAQALYYKLSAGETTFTADTGAVSTIAGIRIVEFQGASSYTLESFQTNQAGGVTSITSPSVTTIDAFEVMVYGIATHGTSAFSNTWTNSFARTDSDAAASTARAEVGYLITSSVGSYLTAETIPSARSMVGVIATFTTTPTALSTSANVHFKARLIVSSTKNATPQTSKPASDISNAGVWVKQDGTTSTNLFNVIDDTPTPDDADYIQSPANPSAAVTEIKFATVTLTGSTSGWRFRVRHQLTGTGSTTCTAQLRQGASTVIATRTLTLGASFLDEVFDLTPVEAALITDGTDLRLRLTAG